MSSDKKLCTFVAEKAVTETHHAKCLGFETSSQLYGLLYFELATFLSLQLVHFPVRSLQFLDASPKPKKPTSLPRAQRRSLSCKAAFDSSCIEKNT
jgi:hypothetical protein